MLKLIHSLPNDDHGNGYQLHAEVTTSRVGKTLSLFQTYPQAQRPRAQRIAQLTLPPQSAYKLAKLIEGEML